MIVRGVDIDLYGASLVKDLKPIQKELNQGIIESVDNRWFKKVIDKVFKNMKCEKKYEYLNSVVKGPKTFKI